MATMRDPKKAPTAFGSRQSPYLTSVSVATQSQASISRVTLSLRSPKSTPSTQCVILRYEEDQNDMPVRSIEGPEQGYTGYKHYTFLAKQHNFDTKPSLDHINYLASSFNVTDTDALHELGPEPVSDLTSLAYADYPARPPLQDKYSQPIYYGTTRNPSVFLAILRIAQLQNPKMDLSAQSIVSLTSVPRNNCLASRLGRQTASHPRRSSTHSKSNLRKATKDQTRKGTRSTSPSYPISMANATASCSGSTSRTSSAGKCLEARA